MEWTRRVCEGGWKESNFATFLSSLFFFFFVVVYTKKHTGRHVKPKVSRYCGKHQKPKPRYWRVRKIKFLKIETLDKYYVSLSLTIISSISWWSRKKKTILYIGEPLTLFSLVTIKTLSSHNHTPESSRTLKKHPLTKLLSIISVKFVEKLVKKSAILDRQASNASHTPAENWIYIPKIRYLCIKGM